MQPNWCCRGDGASFADSSKSGGSGHGCCASFMVYAIRPATRGWTAAICSNREMYRAVGFPPEEWPVASGDDGGSSEWSGGTAGSVEACGVRPFNPHDGLSTETQYQVAVRWHAGGDRLNARSGDMHESKGKLGAREPGEAGRERDQGRQMVPTCISAATFAAVGSAHTPARHWPDRSALDF